MARLPSRMAEETQVTDLPPPVGVERAMKRLSVSRPVSMEDHCPGRQVWNLAGSPRSDGEIEEVIKPTMIL